MDQALVALAASAATTLVNAVTTDGWQAVRAAIGRLLGRGDKRAEESVLETLDEDATVLVGSADAATRAAVQAQWSVRLRDLLRVDPDAADELRRLIADAANAGNTVSAAGHGVAAGRDITIHATNGGVAAGTINGSVAPPGPSTPGAAQA
jgi:hypothetical protein